MELADGGSVREFISKCRNACCVRESNPAASDAERSPVSTSDRRVVKDCYRSACKQVFGCYSNTFHVMGLIVGCAGCL